jgi:hypothetical protein
MKKYNSTSSSPLKSGLGVLRPKPLSKVFVLSKEEPLAEALETFQVQ